MKIIIIDDEIDAGLDLQNVLERVLPGSRITTFTLPQLALDQVREGGVSIAFLDVEMPCVHGLILAKRIKELDPLIKIVFVTGYGQYSLDAYSVPAGGYILKPATDEMVRKVLAELSTPLQKGGANIEVTTFGNFEVFVDKKPLTFSRSKAKELFAYLVDRKGSGITTAQIAGVLWGDKPYNRSLQKQTQNIIGYMMESLRDAKISDVVRKEWNCISIDTSLINCDYYDFLASDDISTTSYNGEYMAQYSWAELTNAVLWKKSKLSG